MVRFGEEFGMNLNVENPKVMRICKIHVNEFYILLKCILLKWNRNCDKEM